MTRSPGPARRLRDAAFGPDPAGPLPTVADPVCRWLRAVALGGQGRYAAAATELAALSAAPDTPVTVAAHAAVTRASHLRQLGGHAAARPLDALGLRLADTAARSGADLAGRTGSPIGERPRADLAGLLRADGVDAAAARIDALTGLAADAVGIGDLPGSHRLLAAADRAAAGHPSWRPRVRMGWVRAELALVEGRAADAVAAADAGLAAAAAARAGGAPALRHELKSRIVLTVALAAAGALDAEDAAARLDACGASAAANGLVPLRWPAALAAADVLPDPAPGALSGDAPDRTPDTPDDTPEFGVTPRCADRVSGPTRRRHAAASALSVVATRADPIGRRVMRVSPWVPGPSHGNVITPFGATSPT